MTCHRLIRSDCDLLLRHASRVHAASPGSAAPPGRLPRWRDAEPPAGRSATWRTQLLDGSVVGWCLEVEPGANGILAHLTAAPLVGRLTLLPASVQRLALHSWALRELAVLARAVEPQRANR